MLNEKFFVINEDLALKETSIAILNENETGGRRGTAPVVGSGKFLFVNQVGLLYLLIFVLTRQARQPHSFLGNYQ